MLITWYAATEIISWVKISDPTITNSKTKIDLRTADFVSMKGQGLHLMATVIDAITYKSVKVPKRIGSWGMINY